MGRRSTRTLSEVWTNPIARFTSYTRCQTPEASAHFERRYRKALIGRLIPEWPEPFYYKKEFDREHPEEGYGLIQTVWKEMPRIHKIEVIIRRHIPYGSPYPWWDLEICPLQVDPLPVQLPPPMDPSEEEAEFQKILELLRDITRDKMRDDRPYGGSDSYHSSNICLYPDKEFSLDNSVENEVAGLTPPMIRALQHKGYLQIPRVDPPDEICGYSFGRANHEQSITFYPSRDPSSPFYFWHEKYPECWHLRMEIKYDRYYGQYSSAFDHYISIYVWT